MAKNGSAVTSAIKRKANLAARMGAFVAEQKLVGSRLFRDTRVLLISDVRDEMGGSFECVYEALCRECQSPTTAR